MSIDPSLRPRSTRVPFVRPISLRPVDGSSGAEWLFAGNLSLGGCFVRTAQPLPIGTEVKLELEARGQPLPFAVAEVVWTRTESTGAGAPTLPGVGLRFRSLSAEARALVMHLVDLGGTGRGQSRTQPLGLAASAKLPTREPLHAPVGLIRDFLHTPPKALPVAAMREAVTDPHGLPVPVAPEFLAAKPKFEIDVTLFEPEGLGRKPVPSGSVPLMGLGTPLESREPWFEPGELHLQRPAETSFEPASVGPLPASYSEAPPRRGSSLVASLFAGVAVGGAILGALVMAEKGLRLARSPASARIETPAAIEDALAERDNPKETAPVHAAPAVAPKPVAEAHVSAPVAVRAPAPGAPPAAAVTAAIVVTPPAPAKPVPAHEAVAAASAPTSDEGGDIALPTGAAKSVRVSGPDDALEIEPTLTAGSSIDRVFALSSPSRLVIDLNGSSPKGTPHVAGRSGVTNVRLGSRPGGTRLVLDLARPATHVHTQGNRITLAAK